MPAARLSRKNGSFSVTSALADAQSRRPPIRRRGSRTKRITGRVTAIDFESRASPKVIQVGGMQCAIKNVVNIQRSWAVPRPR
jgi:hypothetical protein